MVAAVMTTDKKKVSLYLEEETKTQMERLARLRKRSLSNMIEVLCEEAVREAKASGELINASN